MEAPVSNIRNLTLVYDLWSNEQTIIMVIIKSKKNPTEKLLPDKDKPADLQRPLLTKLHLRLVQNPLALRSNGYLQKRRLCV